MERIVVKQLGSLSCCSKERVVVYQVVCLCCLVCRVIVVVVVVVPVNTSFAGNKPVDTITNKSDCKIAGIVEFL